jgi:hypothetical protein
MHLSFSHTCRMFSPSHCSFIWSPGGVRNMKPIPVASRSKAWVCGRSLDGIAGSNPAEGMIVSCECCVLSGRDLSVGLITRPEESYRVWCVWVWSRNLNNEVA